MSLAEDPLTCVVRGCGIAQSKTFACLDKSRRCLNLLWPAKTELTFQQLTEKEKLSKLTQVGRLNLLLTIWTKGSSQKYRVSCEEFMPKDLRLICSGLGANDLLGKTVLYTFEISGLSFFGVGDLKKLAKNRVALESNHKLYKSERRSSFRLLTFPHHRAYMHLPVTDDETKSGNVFGIKSGMSETGLFKSFLNLIKSEEESGQLEGHAAFRALDLSATGVAVKVGAVEEGLFEKDKIVGPLALELNDEVVEIPEAQVVYKVDLVSQSGEKGAFKIGFKFLGVDEALDQRLVRLVNSALKDFEEEFEDFIK